MRKLLPKDFESLLRTHSLAELQSIFKKCDVNARGGYSKQTAIAFNDCPDELVRWLIGQGADISAEDQYGYAPLHARARHWNGNIGILIELGAGIDQGVSRVGTALHFATTVGHSDNVEFLIQKGAMVDAMNRRGQTPLAYALEQCRNIDIEKLAQVAPLLLKSGAKITPEMKESVARIGKDFEFHRSGFNKDSLDRTSEALGKLYTLFEVSPVSRRTMHDGSSPIIARAIHWGDRHQELWQLLVPSNGAARTVQGEVIRLSGRIHREVDGNGGINWDATYSKMAQALLNLLRSGNALPSKDLAKAAILVRELNSQNSSPTPLCEMAVEWVALNPIPIALSQPDYQR